MIWRLFPRSGKLDSSCSTSFFFLTCNRRFVRRVIVETQWLLISTLKLSELGDWSSEYVILAPVSDMYDKVVTIVQGASFWILSMGNVMLRGSRRSDKIRSFGELVVTVWFRRYVCVVE